MTSLTGWSARLRRIFLPLLAVMLTLPLLSSCYVPDEFLAEIRLAKNGDYALIYRGTLTWAPMIKDVRSGDLSPSEIKEKQDVLIRDLERSGGFQSIEVLGPGRFKVFYERLGRFTGTRKVTFVRRSAEILSLEVLTDGTLHVRANTMPKATDEDQFRSLGIQSRGKLRVVTELPIIGHNAPEVSDGPEGFPTWKTFDWTITHLGQRPPTLVARLFADGYLEPPKLGR